MARSTRPTQQGSSRTILRWGWLAPWLALLGAVGPAWAEAIDLTFLHLNDVYEITPVQGGQRGGLARVATLRQQLLRENPRTYTVLAGDLFSPSALGTATVNGERLAGRQIVAAMNSLGLDYATLGNHEFDLSAEQFLQRLAESRFRWFSGNVTDAAGRPFPNVASTVTIAVRGDRGGRVRVGLIGVMLDSNPAGYVRYRDPIATAREQARALAGQTDVIVAVTHLSIEQDRQLAAAVPEIDLILGGHEHENMQQWRTVARPQRSGCARPMTPIFKADANATTVYVHRLRYDTTSHCLTIASELKPITPALPDEPKTAATVRQWQELGFAGFRAQGFAPERVVATISTAWDGLEASVRNGSTELTRAIGRAMLAEATGAELALYNSGGIRIDDVLPPGPVTEYDIIRVLPFGGQVLTVGVRGDLLQKVLEQGVANRGSGGYLQTAGVDRPTPDGPWRIGGQPIDPDRTYRVAVNDFLISGREQNLGFFKLGEAGITPIAEGRDIRTVLIRSLQSSP